MSDLTKLKIGQIITESQEKDAIHMAIAPVMAREKLCPGDQVGPYADGENIGYDELMSAAENYQANNEYLCQGGRFEGKYLPEEFWTHWEVVTGQIANDKGSFYSCSC